MKTADDEERTLNMQCHLCGDMDSQDHLLQHCTHPDVCVVRRGALDMLEALGRQHVDAMDNSGSALAKALIDSTIKMLTTEEYPSRIWTSNWSSDMIRRLQNDMGIQRVNKKLQANLRSTLVEVGRVLADGAREISRLRHSITRLHDDLQSARAHRQAGKHASMLPQRQPTLKHWLRTGLPPATSPCLFCD